MHFCVHGKRRNTFKKRDGYVIPYVNGCIDSLGDAAVVSGLDTNSGYWKVQIDESGSEKNALT